MKKAVRIGNGCGFWGDNVDAPIVLAERGKLDYLTLEYLAELTMSILALHAQRDASKGFATDFLEVLARLVPALKSQPGLRIVTNAGGMNPPACAAMARAILKNHGLNGVRVAAVLGDDLAPKLDTLLSRGESLINLDTGKSLTSIRDRVVSANAYLGARPICEALDQGARIVITGRVADASLTVGPAAHEFGWDWMDWDVLAGATVAGHLIECGAQTTGGLWFNALESTDLADVGYPIAEIAQDGSFTLTKTPKSTGAINRETVLEQLFYEIGDPQAYLTPDVVANFSELDIEERALDEVHVKGARGKAATPTYKVSIVFTDGFSSSSTVTLVGPNARAKAKACGAMIRKRLERAGVVPERMLVECLGTGDSMPGCFESIDPPEVVLRVAGSDPRREVMERFTREFAPLATTGPPGVAGYAIGRPSVRAVLAFWPALVRKDLVNAEVQISES